MIIIILFGLFISRFMNQQFANIILNFNEAGCPRANLLLSSEIGYFHCLNIGIEVSTGMGES